MSPTRPMERAGGRALPGGRRGRGAGLVALGLVVTVTLPLVSAPSAGAVQEASQDAKLRAKDLGVLEQLLVESVQDAVVDQIRLINEEVRQNQLQAQQAGEPPEYRHQFRSAGEAGARGLFLEDYGVIFTVQVPHVSYGPARSLIISRGNIPITLSGGNDTVAALEQARELQIRSQINLLERSLAQIERMLQEETTSDSGSSLARQMASRIAELEEMHARLAEEVRDEEPGVRDSEAAGRAATEEPRPVAEGAETDVETPEPNVAAPRVPWARLSLDPEETDRARERAEEQRQRIEQAIITGIIDTMAQYGTVVHGLDEDDRIAVVIQPSSYLNDVQRWLRATDRAEEFVVSVGYGDLVELDEGNIDVDEFGERIRVESRLGQPRPANQPSNRR